jgi:iron complex outermembrane receptor protein
MRRRIKEKRMRKIILVTFIGLLVVNSAFGEESDKKNILNKIIDTTTLPLKVLLEPSHRLEPIVVTPSRYEESALDVSKDITVIDHEKIEKAHVKYVPDLLKDLAGINVRSTLGNGKATEVDIRGFGESSPSNVLVMVNGRRTNQIDISGVDWAQIDIDSVERIEIIRGPQSVLYGDNATGGVINIITKTGAGKKPGADFKYATGSYRYNLYSGHIEGGTDFLDYYAGLSESDTNGYRKNNDLETTDFNSNLTFKPADYLNIKLEGAYHKDWYGQPGALKPADIASVGWRGTINPNDRAKTDDMYFMGTPEIKCSAGTGEASISTEILARGRRTASVSYSVFGNTEINNHIKTLGVTPKVVTKVDILGIVNKLIVGFDYYGDKDEILSSNAAVPGAKDSIIITKSTFGLYAEDTAQITSRLSVNGGVRYERAYYKFDQQAVLQSINTKSPIEYAADAGINYKYNDRSAIYANYARSFRFPAVDEWYSAIVNWGGGPTGGLNLDLAPQIGNNYEIGIKDDSLKCVGVKADLFLMDLKHELYFDPMTFANSVYERTRHQGVEVEGHLYPFDDMDIFTNYTYQNAFFVGTQYAGNEIPMVPHHKIAGGLNYKFMDCVNIKYLVTFVGSRRFISDQRNFQPKLKSYITHDVKISYYKYGLEAYAAIYNIFNEKYAEQGVLDFTRTVPGYYSSPGTNFVIGAKYKF